MSEDNMSDSRVAVVCSSRFNAVGIVLSLREIGWQGRIVCLRINDGRRSIAERWPDLCECASITVDEPGQLWREIAAIAAPEDVAALFFCDERFHSACTNGSPASIFPEAKCWMGPRSELETVLDRWKFYEYIQNRGLAKTPATLKNPCDPWEHFPDGFRARVWRSWRGMEKLPRGRTIRTKQQFEEWKKLCESQGVDDSQWGCQELLSTDPRHTVSVCGWHDPSSHYYKVTRWLRQRGENGWLIETVGNYEELRETTHRILSSLQYKGPFEMEFMKERGSDIYKVIEMNPRFWMQHRIVGNELVRRYINTRTPSHIPQPQPRYWLNTDEALKRLVTLRGFYLLPLIGRSVWSTPIRGSLGTLFASLAGYPRRMLRRLFRKY